ncbi:MAG TPA: hypothetical protein VLG71_02240 [Candidatus Limnocylindria bacterium]|nr:hypothetical protein [Candidatus Limnocylindria bacterium]
MLLLTLNTTGKALSSRSFGFWQSIAISDTNYVLVKFLTPTLILNVLMVLIFPCYFFYQTDSLVPFLKIWVAANLYWGGMLAFILVFSSIFYKKSLLALALFCLATLSPFFSEVTPYFSRFFSEGVVWMLQQKLVSREITDKGFKEIYTWGYRYDLTWSDILHNPYCYAYVALGICFISIAITLRRRHRVQF